MKKIIKAAIELTFGDATITIMKSGWGVESNRQYYHVIEEDPTEGDYFYKHSFLSERVVTEKYDIPVTELRRIV